MLEVDGSDDVEAEYETLPLCKPLSPGHKHWLEERGAVAGREHGRPPGGRSCLNKRPRPRALLPTGLLVSGWAVSWNLECMLCSDR